MRIHKWLLAILLMASSSFCGVAGIASLGALLNQADAVVVATAANGSAAAGILNVSLTVMRTLKGSPNAGSTITATFSSPNVINPGASSPTVRTNGSVLATDLAGKHGLWFLQQSGASWIVLPLASGDISTADLYVVLPPGNLSQAFAYDVNASPKTKLMQEIGAAAVDPTSSSVISRLNSSRALADLGSDFQSVLIQLASSPQITTNSTGLAGLIRLGTPSALNTVASSNLGALPADAYSQLANSVCEYRNTDVSGVAALGTLVSSTASNGMRICSTHALREIHSPETLPFLQMLLTDSSVQIRYDAVIGIAQYAMGFPVATMAGKPAAMATFRTGPAVTNDMGQHYPSQGLFEQNEQEYINFWKTWLAAHPAK